MQRCTLLKAQETAKIASDVLLPEPTSPHDLIVFLMGYDLPRATMCNKQTDGESD